MIRRVSRWFFALALIVAVTTPAIADGPFGALFNVSSINGNNGFVMKGEKSGDQFGFSVSSAGDVNGDGFNDIIIGAHRADPGGVRDAGASYVIFGSADVGASGSIDLSTLDGTNGFVCAGGNLNRSSGSAVSSAGDVNDDGFDDLLIGDPEAYVNGRYPGASYVVFGSASIGQGGVVSLSSLNGPNGFVCTGVDNQDDCGAAVSYAGDLNGDGVADLAIGAPSAEEPNRNSDGETYVVFGGANVGAGGIQALSSLDGTNGFVCIGIENRGGCGFALSSAGDVNDDGFDDLLIGGPYSYQGKSRNYVIFGGPGMGAGGAFDLQSMDGTTGFYIREIDYSDRGGISVSGAGDVNNDGVDDLIIGASYADYLAQPNCGQSYVLFGAAGIGTGGQVGLTSLDGTNGFVCNGTEGELSGESVSSAGDVNGDGVADLIIRARSYGQSPSCYVVFGGDVVGAGGAVELSALSGDNGFAVNGFQTRDHANCSVASAGDINGDGIDDLIMGASEFSQNGSPVSGEAYVIFGRATCPADLNNDGVVDTVDLGIVLAEFGVSGPQADINGDNLVDTADLGIVIGSFGSTCR